MIKSKYTIEYCQEILNAKNNGFIVIDIIREEKRCKDKCVLSCGNENHTKLTVACSKLKTSKNICYECKVERIIKEKTEKVKSIFENTKYHFYKIDHYRKNNDTIDMVHFYDNDGYYYMSAYDSIINANYKAIKNNDVCLTYPSNIYSIQNIKRFIENNNCLFKYLSGNYVNNTSPLIMKCLKCGEKYISCWASIHMSKGCNLCCNNIKRTNEEFLNKVCELVGNDYSFLEEYKNSSEKIMVKHNLCGYIYSIRPIDFLNGSRCDKCSGTFNIDKNEFEKKLFKKHKNKFSLIGIYNGWKKLCDFKCNDCGNTMSKFPATLCKETYGCRECFFKTLSLSGNPAYIDGSITIYEFMRSATHPWRVNAFVDYNNKCAISGSNKDKHVHHVNIQFREIVSKCHKELNLKRRRLINEYDESDLLKLKELCLKIHLDEVVGIVLCKDVHFEFHKQYSCWNTTYEQLNEFAKSKGANLEEILKGKLNIV